MKAQIKWQITIRKQKYVCYPDVLNRLLPHIARPNVVRNKSLWDGQIREGGGGERGGDTAVNWPSKSYTDRITGGRLFTAQRMFRLTGGREQRQGQTPKIIRIWLCVCGSVDGSFMEVQRGSTNSLRRWPVLYSSLNPSIYSPLTNTQKCEHTVNTKQ
jgi:hypothetical protein